MKIYTRTGDTGISSLYSGERRPKDDVVFAALGDVDEVNSAVGIAREFCKDVDAVLAEQLESIQSRLFDVGAAVATPLETSSERKLQRTEFGGREHAVQLEGWIDSMMEHLPPLTQFILPGGGQASAFLHMARSISRRAERSVVPLVAAGATDASVGVYLNRLSDYLFTAARYAAFKARQPETTWKKAPLPCTPAAGDGQ